MSIQFRELVDAEELAIKYLLEQIEVTDVFGQRIGTQIPPGTGSQGDGLRAVINRVGGVPNIEQWLDNPRLQVRVYANRNPNQRNAARAGAALIQAWLHQLRVDSVRPEGVVTDCRDNIGLQWLPDPDTGRPGFMFELELSVHPLPQGS